LGELPSQPVPNGAIEAAWSILGRIQTPRIVLNGHTAEITSASFDNGGSRVLTTSMDQTARIWRADGGAALVLTHNSEVWDGAFVENGNRIITLSSDSLSVWSSDGERLFSIPAAGGWGSHLKVSDDGNTAFLDISL